MGRSSYSNAEIQARGKLPLQMVDKLDTNLGVRLVMRQKVAIMDVLVSAEIRALIVCAACRKYDGSKQP